jgi:hypothetical protein
MAVMPEAGRLLMQPARGVRGSAKDRLLARLVRRSSLYAASGAESIIGHQLDDINRYAHRKSLPTNIQRKPQPTGNARR